MKHLHLLLLHISLFLMMIMTFFVSFCYVCLCIFSRHQWWWLWMTMIYPWGKEKLITERHSFSLSYWVFWSFFTFIFLKNIFHLLLCCVCMCLLWRWKPARIYFTLFFHHEQQTEKEKSHKIFFFLCIFCGGIKIYFCLIYQSQFFVIFKHSSCKLYFVFFLFLFHYLLMCVFADSH